MGFLIFFPIIIGIIVIHELGHFITAKLSGVKVLEFGLGYPPRLFGIRRGETEYTVNLLPLGGFVKMLGEDDPTEHRSLASKSIRTRLVVLTAGSVMNLILPIGLLTAAAMIPVHRLEGPVTIVGIAPSSPAEQAGFAPGDELVAINNRDIRNTRDAHYNVLLNLGKATDFTVRRGEELALLRATPRFRPPAGEGQTGISMTMRQVTVTSVEPGSPAERGGVLPGDRIVAISGVNDTRALSTLAQQGYLELAPSVVVSAVAAGSPGAEAGFVPGDRILSVEEPSGPRDLAALVRRGHLNLFFDSDVLVARGRGTLSLHVSPRLGDASGGTTGLSVASSGGVTEVLVQRGEEVLTLRLDPPPGVDRRESGLFVELSAGNVVRRSEPLWRALPKSFRQLGDLLTLTKNGLFSAIFSRGEETGPLFTGPVGIAQATGELAQGGTSALLSWTAILSLSIGILNLLPLPALDGGRVAFVLIELVRRGKRISPQKEGLVHFVGFVVMIGFVAVISYFDIMRLLSGDPIIR